MTGTPAAGTGGSYPLVFMSRNAVRPRHADLHAAGQPDRAFTSANALTVNQNEAASFTVTTSGFPGAVISASSLPPGMTLTPNQGAGSALLSGTPSVGGVYPLTLTAFNGVGAAAVQAFTITVRCGQAARSAVERVHGLRHQDRQDGGAHLSRDRTRAGDDHGHPDRSRKAGKRVTIATAKATVSAAGTGHAQNHAQQGRP